jgi:hypothetical protein
MLYGKVNSSFGFAQKTYICWKWATKTNSRSGPRHTSNLDSKYLEDNLDLAIEKIKQQELTLAKKICGKIIKLSSYLVSKSLLWQRFKPKLVHIFCSAMMSGFNADLALYNVSSDTKVQADYAMLDIGNTCPRTGLFTNYAYLNKPAK